MTTLTVRVPDDLAKVLEPLGELSLDDYDLRGVLNTVVQDLLNELDDAMGDLEGKANPRLGVAKPWPVLVERSPIVREAEHGIPDLLITGGAHITPLPSRVPSAASS